MTKLQAHRGVSTECPENTMPAFELAIEQGYAAIELDPIVTKDLQVVLHHDNTISRTGRKADGSVAEDLAVAELTYEQLSAYDFGIHKHVKFRGVGAPRLKDVLPMARKAGITLKLDAKIFTVHLCFCAVDMTDCCFRMPLSDFVQYVPPYRVHECCIRKGMMCRRQVIQLSPGLMILRRVLHNGFSFALVVRLLYYN